MTSNSGAAENPTIRPPEAAASPAGTADHAERHRASFTGDFFRSTSFGLTASSIGIGTYLGECTDEDDQAYRAAIGAALGRGVNVIDAASNYRAQRSERVICHALLDAARAGTARSSVIVCSKGGYIPFDGAPPASREEYQGYVRRTFFEPGVLQADQLVGGGHSLWPRFLQFCLARSRQNLGVRTIDVYYLHNPEQQLATVGEEVLAMRIRAAFQTLEESVTRGEIGVYGCATWDGLRTPPGTPGHLSIEWLVERAREVAGDAHHFRALQLPINLAMPEGVRSKTQRLSGVPATVLEAAESFGLTVMASAPLLQGRLTANLPEAVRNAVSGEGTDAQWALAFVRGIPGLTTAVVGMKTVAHLEENLGSVAVRI